MNVRWWHREDAAQLLPLIHAYLQETQAFGYDYQVTANNVDLILRLGMVHAALGDPVLLCEIDGKIVGWTAWISSPNELDFDLTGVSGLGMGTYVVFAHRRMGVAKLLHQRAEIVAASRGFTRIDRFAVPDTIGAVMLEREEYKPAFTVYRKEIRR